MKILMTSLILSAFALSLICVFLDQIENILRKVADKMHFGPNWERKE